jgi:spermidine synthase
VSLCTCIDGESERRRAETTLANLAETCDARVETRVSRANLLDFLDANAAGYDLVLVGSSRDRSRASRFVSPPTFERLRDVDADVAVVDRGSV